MQTSKSFNLKKDFFKTIKKHSKEEKKSLYNKINRCLLEGFFLNIAELMDPKIGYFFHSITKCSKIHSQSLYYYCEEKKDFPPFLCSAEIIKDTHLESKWLFPVDMTILGKISRVMENQILKNKKDEIIPTEVLEFKLSSIIKREISRKDWLLDYVVKGNSKKPLATIFDLYKQSDASFSVAVSKTNKEEVEKKIKKYLENLELNITGTYYRIGLEYSGQILLGDGLRIKGVLANDEANGFYVRHFPRNLLKILKIPIEDARAFFTKVC